MKAKDEKWICPKATCFKRAESLLAATENEAHELASSSEVARDGDENDEGRLDADILEKISQLTAVSKVSSLVGKMEQINVYVCQVLY